MIEINFLSQQNKKITSQQKSDRVYFLYAFVACAICTTILVLTLAVSLYLNFRLKRVQAQVVSAKQQIDSERSLEANYLFFINKLTIIRELFDQRAEKQIAITFFTDLFGPDVKISGINYNMETGILSLLVTSPHIFITEHAFEVLEKPEVKEQFTSLTKTNLIRNGEGEYSFTLTITFGEEFESEALIIEEEY